MDALARRADAPKAAIAAESLARASSGRLLGWMQIVIVAAVVTATIALEAVETQAAIDSEVEQRRNGYHLLVASNTNEQAASSGVSRADCERLRHVDGISASGSVSTILGEALVAAPSQTVTYADASPGFLAVMATVPWLATETSFAAHEPASSDDYLVSPATAERLEVSAGDNLGIAGRGGRPVAVAPLDALGSGVGRTVIGVVPAVGEAEFCYAAATTPLLESPQAPLRVVLGGGVSIWRVLSGAENLTSVDADYRSRLSRHAPIAAGALTLLFVALGVWLRRADAALYTALGVRSRDVRLILGLELGVLLSLGVELGLIAGVLVALVGGTQLEALLPAVASGLAAGLTSFVALVLLLLAWRPPSPTHALKDR